MGANQQLWVYTASNGTLMQLGNDGGADGPCLRLASGGGSQVISSQQDCTNVSAAWEAVQGKGTAGGQMLRSRADAGLCLSSAGGDVEAPVDEWCIANNNMCAAPMIRRPLTRVPLR